MNPRNLADLWSTMRAVRREYGKGLFEQVAEIRALRRRSQAMGITDYYDYQLFRDDLPSDTRKENFAGWRMEGWLARRLNSYAHAPICHDKLFAYAVLSTANAPIPEIFAIYDARGRQYRGAARLRTPEEALTWMASHNDWPVFVKPVSGSLGAGGTGIVSYDADTDIVCLSNGETQRASAFVRSLAEPRASTVVGDGYVFQRYVTQHAAIRRIAPGGVSTVRAVVLRTAQGPVFFRAVWRVNVGRNMTDNYVKGRSGNLLAHVDVSSGVVGEVVRGSRLSRRVHDLHPDSGERIPGFQLPHWDRVVETCLDISDLFPMFRFQHWDVAIGEHGPCVLELNPVGDIAILQFASRRGLIDDTMRGVLADLAPAHT